MASQENSLRQALAIAIVRSKRRCEQEAAAWSAKCQRLEAELQQQQAKQDQLKAWVSTVLQRGAEGCDTGAAADTVQQDATRQQRDTPTFLPPLAPAGDAPGHGQLQMQHAGDFHVLQHQLLAAAAVAGGPYSAVADVLEGKAAALSSMLLNNVQMLQRLSEPQDCSLPGTDSSHSGSSSAATISQGHASEAVSCVSSFITSTLLRAPRSSLSSAYMKQSAASLAALLAAPASRSCQAQASATPSQHSQQQQQQQQQQSGCNAPEAVAVQVVRLMQQLLQLRAAAAAQPPAGTAATDDCCSSGMGQAMGDAAAVMLKQLSVFPSTALLLCLAMAQHLQQAVQELHSANAAVMGVSLGNISAGNAHQALLAASQVFQASHELLMDLEAAVLQIPVWGVALADSSWTPRALEDLVASATALYQSCASLQPQQPLLAGRMCHLCATLATALQQLAANGDAPGMKGGMGAELRSVTGSLCVKLRDLFMPAGC